MLRILLWIMALRSGQQCVEEVYEGDNTPDTIFAFILWAVLQAVGIHLFRVHVIWLLLSTFLYSFRPIRYRLTVQSFVFWIHLLAFTSTTGASVSTGLLWAVLLAVNTKVVLNSRYGKSVTRKVNSFFGTKREAAKALARGYKPLRLRRREFRLLTLLPDDQDGIPICTLEIFTLDKHPPYEALSYTWDKQPSAVSILVNDRRATVSQGLDTALRHLRRTDSARVLWIDAICIDQGNIYERSQQVQLMRFIYNFADRVLVWLGPGNESTDRGMKHMRSINENPPTTDPLVALRYYRETFFTQQIFERPWFSRVWIIQEVVMAKIEPLVGCGHEWIPWSYLFNTYTTVTHNALGDVERTLPTFFHTLRGHNLAKLNTMRVKKEETSLEWYLRTISQFEATDPRDKVYSLLGLARDRDRYNLVPDYDETNTPESLYPKVVQHFIDIDHSLNILSYFRKPLEIPTAPLTPWQGYKASNLGVARWRPTWMPNFDKTVVDKHHPLPLLGKVSYKASGVRKAQANVSSDLRILSAKGIFFDSIGSVMEPCPDSMIFVQYLRRVATLFGNTADSYFRYNCSWGEVDSRRYLDRTEAHWRTMCADRSPIEPEMHYDVQRPTYKLMTPAHESFHSMYSVYLRHEAVPYDFDPPPGLLHPDIDPRRLCDMYVEPFSLACKQAMQGRAPFITRCGFAGLGPLDARPGDVVAILFGADVPFVLRRDQGLWAFLGDCYVHGIMQGELIALTEQLGRKLNGPKFCKFNIL